MLIQPTRAVHNTRENESLVIGVRGDAALVKRIKTLRGSLTVSLFCRHAIQHFCDALDAEDPGAKQRICALCAEPNRGFARPGANRAPDRPDDANRDPSHHRCATRPGGGQAPGRSGAAAHTRS